MCNDPSIEQPDGAAMIAYLFGKTLTIVARPCNGVEFQNGEHIAVSGKREANAICKARGLKAWNF